MAVGCRSLGIGAPGSGFRLAFIRGSLVMRRHGGPGLRAGLGDVRKPLFSFCFS